MTLQMPRAFNSKMLTKVVRYSVEKGSFDENNVWINGKSTRKNIWGVLKTGNQFSQFDEGEAIHTEDGGTRFSDYKTLYVTDKFPVQKEDKIGYKGNYYNVLQRSNDATYGFYSVLLEKSKEWRP